MAKFNVTEVNAQKNNQMAEAGKVGRALVEWGDPEGAKLHRKVVAQEETTEQAKRSYDGAMALASTLQAEATEAGKVFDDILDGAVAQMKLHRLGPVPALTDFYKADRYAFADEVVSRLSGGGSDAVWLEESLRKAKLNALHRAEKQREAAAQVVAARQGYQAAVGRLRLVVQEARLVLRASLPANSPVLRHLQPKRKDASTPEPAPLKPAA